jgi:hypothetical protein
MKMRATRYMAQRLSHGEEHAISTSLKRWLRHGRKLSAHVILIKDMLANATLINSFAGSNEWRAK